MSKNLTLKGLAFGALVALSSSVIAGAPAQAATVNGITTTIDGTATKLPVWSKKFAIKFKLASATSDLKFAVENPNNLNLSDSIVRINADADYASGTTQYVEASGAATESSAAQVWAFPAANTTTRSVVTVDVSAGAALDADKSVSVTAFVDANDNNVADSGEKSETVKIEWIKSVTSTFTLDQPFVGEGVLQANVGLSGINLEQVDLTQITATFDDDATFGEGVGETGAPEVADVAADALASGATTLAITPAFTTIADGTRYYAQLKLGGSVVGSLISKNVVVAETTSATYATVTADANLRVAGDGDVRVRPGTSAFVISAKGIKTGTTAVSSGKKAKVTVTPNSLTSGATITVGTKTLKSGDSAYTYEATTNSDGKVVVNVTAASFKTTDDYFSVLINIEGQQAQSATTFTVDPVDSYKLADLDGAVGVKAIKPGSAVSLNIGVTDEYGVSPTDRLRAEVMFDNGGSNDYVGKPEFVNGKVVISYTDAFASTTSLPRSYGVVVLLQKRDATSGAWDYVHDLGGVYASGQPIESSYSTIQLSTGAAATSLNFASTEDGDPTALNVTAEKLAAGDERLGGSVTNYATDGDFTTLSGTVEDKDNQVVPGAVVTVKATGSAVFVVNRGISGSQVSAVNTITVYADQNGQFSVDAFSQTGGTVTYTATVGSVSETAKVIYEQGTLGSGSTLTFTGAAYATPGSVYNASFILKDKLGNPIASQAVTFSLTGAAGWLANETATTNSAGVVSARLVTGISDKGAVVITAFVENGPNDITTLANVTIGEPAPVVIAPTAAVSGSTGKFFVSATNAAGKKVVVKVAGKFFGSFTGTAAKKSVALKAPKGSHKVTVFVGGKLTATKTITVK